MTKSKRREVLVALAGLAAPPLRAQALRRGSYRIGILATYFPAATIMQAGGAWSPFVQRLQSLGYVEGQNLQFEVRSAEGKLERLPALATDLVRSKPDLIMAVSNPPVLALQAAASTIPIVMLFSHAAVEIGLVKSLGRPGGNLTGVDSMSPELDAKRLQFLREVAPKARRIAAIFNPDGDPGMQVHLKVQSQAARALGFEVRPFEVTSTRGFDAVFASIAQDRPDALMTFSDSLLLVNRQSLAAFALAQRLPSVYEFTAFVDAGGLYSYGAVSADVLRRGADLAHRVLEGARPTDLPVELPTTFESALNLRTARSLGVVVPASTRLMTDRVIE